MPLAPRSPISRRSRASSCRSTSWTPSAAVSRRWAQVQSRPCRMQVADFGGDGPCALIGGGNAHPIFAAFWHTVLVRYVDFMDNFLAPTETCHTADNFGVALTIAEYVGGSGRDLMLAVALAYTVQSRFVDHANFMTRGFDHTAQLAFSLNAAAGRLLGLSEAQIASRIAIAAGSDA